MNNKQKVNSTYGVENAITPIDGRNRHKLQNLIPYFSELALDKYRFLVEIKYLLKLSEYAVIRKFTRTELISIYRYIDTLGKDDYQKIRKIETETNHELMAVVKYLQQQLRKILTKDIVEMVHFGLTSDDINNIAYALMIKKTCQNVLFPEINKIVLLLKNNAKKYKSIPMLSRTHGQLAVPTTVGKEFLIYYKRLFEVMKQFNNVTIKAKLTGNVGNLNVHKFIFPKINWLKFSQELVKSLGLEPDLVTTQIEPYDSLISIFQNLLTINNQLLGLCVDFWIYISFNYFQQKMIKKEVGSSALPHKVNPIYFEGAEGGLGIANALLEFYCRKLASSRLQRDLSDSTVRRSFGIAFGYCLLSYQSVAEALGRIEPDITKINQDLNSHWEILSEAIQNFLKTKGYKDGYEKTKQFFRGKILLEKDIKQFVAKLKLNQEDKEKLFQLCPEKYTGYAEELVDKFL